MKEKAKPNNKYNMVMVTGNYGSGKKRFARFL